MNFGPDRMQKPVQLRSSVSQNYFEEWELRGDCSMLNLMQINAQFFRVLLGIALVCLLVDPSWAQRQFVFVTGIPPLRDGAHAGADFDGDGDEDVFVSGRAEDGTLHTVLYKFLRRRVVQLGPLAKPEVYADYQQVPFFKTSVMKGSVTWHDMNGDSRPDLVVTGLSISGYTSDNEEILAPTTSIYLNEGSEDFGIVPNHGLPGVYNSKVAAGDFNGDGFQDLVIGGQSATGPVLNVWLGDRLQRFVSGPTSFSGVQPSSISAADIDRDNDLDFIVAGVDAVGNASIKLFVNDGNAQFTEAETSLPNLFFGGTAFGDVDFDGDPDLLINGGHLDPVFMRGETSLLINDGAGHFSKAQTNFKGLYGGGVSLIDLDRDTDADVFSWGIESLNQIGSEQITVSENIDAYFLPIGSAPSILNGSVALFDYDGNGRKDAFLAGDRDGVRSMFIYEF